MAAATPGPMAMATSLAASSFVCDQSAVITTSQALWDLVIISSLQSLIRRASIPESARRYMGAC